jgi:hypothetical protein
LWHSLLSIRYQEMVCSVNKLHFLLLCELCILSRNVTFCFFFISFCVLSRIFSSILLSSAVSSVPVPPVYSWMDYTFVYIKSGALLFSYRNFGIRSMTCAYVNAVLSRMRRIKCHEQRRNMLCISEFYLCQWERK